MAQKILIHSLIFSPDGVSTAYLYNDIALRFKRQGFDVSVLTTTPHFNVVEEQIKKQPLKWKIWGICKKSSFYGIEVIHIPQKKFKNTFLRLIGFIYWHIVAFLIGLFEKNIDIIISPSPPLTVGLINIILAKFKRCKVIYNVQEIYPDILNLKEGIILKCLQKLEYFVYNHSDAVTTIDQVFYNIISPRFRDISKLRIIPNFVDIKLYNPENGKKGIKGLDNKLFPQNNSIKLLYAGNIGFAQDWEPLINLADQTRNRDIEYFIIGEGVMKPYIIEQVSNMKLNKVHILPYQPRELMPAIIAYSDIQFIFMNPEMEKQGFPSKVYTIMSCAKPLLICSGIETPIVNFLKDIGCAKLITNKNDKVDEMELWLESITKDFLQEMGNKGAEIIKNHYTNDIVTLKYIQLAEEILNK